MRRSGNRRPNISPYVFKKKPNGIVDTSDVQTLAFYYTVSGHKPYVRPSQLRVGSGKETKGLQPPRQHIRYNLIYSKETPPPFCSPSSLFSASGTVFRKSLIFSFILSGLTPLVKTLGYSVSRSAMYEAQNLPCRGLVDCGISGGYCQEVESAHLDCLPLVDNAKLRG